MPAHQLKSDPTIIANSKSTIIARNSITTGNMDITGVRRKTLRGWDII